MSILPVLIENARRTETELMLSLCQEDFSAVFNGRRSGFRLLPVMALDLAIRADIIKMLNNLPPVENIEQKIHSSIEAALMNLRQETLFAGDALLNWAGDADLYVKLWEGASPGIYDAELKYAIKAALAKFTRSDYD